MGTRRYDRARMDAGGSIPNRISADSAHVVTGPRLRTAMSTDQWSAYEGARASATTSDEYLRLVDIFRDLTGYRYVIPTPGPPDSGRHGVLVVLQGAPQAQDGARRHRFRGYPRAVRRRLVRDAQRAGRERPRGLRHRADRGRRRRPAGGRNSANAALEAVQNRGLLAP